jgi:hypothetical protein
MIPHKITDRYCPAIWENLNQKIRILIIYSCWRGCFDTIQLFVNSIRKNNIELIIIDWRKDSFIFKSKPRRGILDLDVIDDIAKKYDCNLVIFLGAGLRLNKPVDPNSLITYSNYQISTISHIDDQLNNFNYTHFLYSAHSYTQIFLKKSIWLPTSIDVELFKNLYCNKKNKYNILCLWNKSLNSKNQDRLNLINEMINDKIDFHHFGALLEGSQTLNSLEAIEAINNCKFNFDHNTDASLNYSQFNDRFIISALLKTPALSFGCYDLDMCYDNYIKYDHSISLLDNFQNLYDLQFDELQVILESCYNRTLADHDNDSRWAQIIHDHVSRVNST